LGMAKYKILLIKKRGKGKVFSHTFSYFAFDTLWALTQEYDVLEIRPNQKWLFLTRQPNP
ncbi:MAG TPA: hypothetical protein VEH09_10735, partial [Thermodesulfobacteriota bacterium]|nr:hypothetical protein [Thermodesulfobacteriota bacterium]